jgi:hypothetical protein
MLLLLSSAYYVCIPSSVTDSLLPAVPDPTCVISSRKTSPADRAGVEMLVVLAVNDPAGIESDAINTPSDVRTSILIACPLAGVPTYAHNFCTVMFCGTVGFHDLSVPVVNGSADT